MSIYQISIRNALRSYVYMSSGDRSPHRPIFLKYGYKASQSFEITVIFLPNFTLLYCHSIHIPSLLLYKVLLPMPNNRAASLLLPPSVQGHAGYVLSLPHHFLIRNCLHLQAPGHCTIPAHLRLSYHPRSPVRRIVFSVSVHGHCPSTDRQAGLAGRKRQTVKHAFQTPGCSVP